MSRSDERDNYLSPVQKAESGEYVPKHCRRNILEGSDISYVEAARHKVKKSANSIGRRRA